jgi:hypothetical protein
MNKINTTLSDGHARITNDTVALLDSDEYVEETDGYVYLDRHYSNKKNRIVMTRIYRDERNVKSLPSLDEMKCLAF